MEQERIKSPRRVAVDPASAENICLDACPYLGLLEDPRTTLAFPHVANHCQSLPTPVEVDLAHQRAYCLSKQYKSCHLYRQAEILPGSLESFTEKHRSIVHFDRRTAGVLMSALMLLLIVAAAIVWWPLPGESMQDVAAMAASLTREAVSDVSGFASAVSVGRMQTIVKEAGAAEQSAVLNTVVETSVNSIADSEQPALDTAPEFAETLPAGAGGVAENGGTPETAASAPAGPLPAAIMQGFAVEKSAAATAVQNEAEPVAVTAVEATEPAELEQTGETGQAAQSEAATADLPASGMVTVATGALNLRSGPGIEYPSLAVAFNGQQVELLGEGDGGSWVRVRMGDGLEGWMHKEYLTPGT